MPNAGPVVRESYCCHYAPLSSRIVGRRSRVVVVLMHLSFPCVIVPARAHARALTLDVEEDRLRCLRAESRGGLLSPVSFVALRGSALPPQADMCGAARHVRYGQKRTSE
jgi:hypothetical protein